MSSIRGRVLIFGLLLNIHFSLSDTSDYHGEISEDALPNDIVRLDRDILVTERDSLDGDKICGFTLYKSLDYDVPFKIVLVDQLSGLAKIQLEANAHLNFAKQHTYSFQIAAHDCIDDHHAPRETVHIEVLPSSAPTTPEQPAAESEGADSTWEEDSYTLQVEEGKLYDDILQLEIEGLEGDALRLCQFHITTPGVPFVIDNEERMGILRNTEKLWYEQQHNYILEVMAYHCGDSDKTDKPLLIDIQVKQACVQGWQGVDELMTYDAKQLIKPIAGEAKLTLCDDTCEVEHVRVAVTLNTKGISKNCDRDTYSVQNQRQLCGAADEIVDLLPSSSEWTESVPRDDGKEGDEVFAFDGSTVAIEVPDDTFNHTLDSEFTIMTWMRHEPDDDEMTSHKKEHILCNSDGEGKNRHHYSLFVHNCKLVLLLRQEYAPGVDLKEFKPAEWRWSVPEVCDGQWHHYAISMTTLSALLHIDGAPFSDLPHHNPDVIDDWALHPVADIHSTKLVVGACWMGQEQHMTQYFQGYLAGLSILNGAVERDSVLKCMTTCAEKLDFHAMSEMKTGMTVSFNSEMSQITIEGNSVDPVENLFRKVGYENSRAFPTQGHRSIQIVTEVNCSDHRQVVLPTLDTVIAVPAPATPSIEISGTEKQSHRVDEFVPGILIFPDVEILAGTDEELEELAMDRKLGKMIEKEQAENLILDEEEAATKPSAYKLDSCLVKVEPPMNFDDYNKEHLRYPENLIDQLMLEVYQKENGLIISGPESVENYESIVRQLKYYNSRADDVILLTFTLTCSELNGRFVSNQFAVQVSVEHEVHAPPEAHYTEQEEAQQYVPPAMDNHAQDNSLSQQLKAYPQSQNSLDKAFIKQSGAHSAAGAAGVGMVIIVVVCVGFLLFMIVLGVIRIRSTHQRTRDVMDEKPEMEWDNSALTITVNPMDQPGAYEDGEMAGVHGDDSDSDDDMSSYHGDHDDADSSEEEPDIRELKSRGLEWDESDLSKYQCKV